MGRDEESGERENEMREGRRVRKWREWDGDNNECWRFSFHCDVSNLSLVRNSLWPILTHCGSVCVCVCDCYVLDSVFSVDVFGFTCLIKYTGVQDLAGGGMGADTGGHLSWTHARADSHEVHLYQPIRVSELNLIVLASQHAWVNQI